MTANLNRKVTDKLDYSSLKDAGSQYLRMRKMGKMNDRVYVLLDVIDGKSQEVVGALTGKSGVVSADVLENPPELSWWWKPANGNSWLH